MHDTELTVDEADSIKGGELHEVMTENLTGTACKLDLFIECLEKFMDKKNWAGFFCKSLGHTVSFASFSDYVTDKTISGLGITEQRLLDLVGHDNALHTKVEKDLEKPLGGATYNPKGTNQYTKPVEEPDLDGTDMSVPSKPTKRRSNEGGNSKSAAVKRLRTEGKEDLADKVESGEITAQKAMVDSGLRRPRFTVFCDSPSEAAKVIFTKFTKVHVKLLIDDLQKMLEEAEEQ